MTADRRGSCARRSRPVRRSGRSRVEVRAAAQLRRDIGWRELARRCLKRGPRETETHRATTRRRRAARDCHHPNHVTLDGALRGDVIRSVAKLAAPRYCHGYAGRDHITRRVPPRSRPSSSSVAAGSENRLVVVPRFTGALRPLSRAAPANCSAPQTRDRRSSRPYCCVQLHSSPTAALLQLCGRAAPGHHFHPRSARAVRRLGIASLGPEPLDPELTAESIFGNSFGSPAAP